MTDVYFNNPGGVVSVTSTHPYGDCQAFSFVEFNATAETGTYDTTRTITNAYGASVTGMSGTTGAMQRSGELVVWVTGQHFNPETHIPGPGMSPAASNGAPNGVGMSSEIEFATAPSASSFTASSSWSTSAPAVATVTSIPVTWLDRTACDDGFDNDSDGRVDYPADPGCSSTTDSSEAPDPQCGDGIDNDADGRTDYPGDPGCTGSRDNSEGVTCTTNSGVKACLGFSPGPEVHRLVLHSADIAEGEVHTIAGYLDVYRFALPNGTTVNVPCVVLVQDGKRIDLCAAAGGTFVTRAAVLAEQPVAEPVPVRGPEIASVGVCHAELVATVNDLGVTSSPAFTLC